MMKNIDRPNHITQLGVVNRFIPDYEPAFPSLLREQANLLEDLVKADYEIYDFQDTQNPGGYSGWRVKNRTNDEEIIYSPNSRFITTKEYLIKDDDNEPVENLLDLIARVAVNIATAEGKYEDNEVVETAKRFARRMIYQEFAPNTPTFANAGGHLQQLAACFGMIPEDHLATDDIGEDPEKQGNGIIDILRYGCMIQKSGGGTGYNFSYTRPRNSGIATTGGRASGPVSWLRGYDGMTKEINQGGFRRGANMGVLEYWHPDIFEFLSAKANNKIPFFNLSMGTDAEFWDKFESEGYFYLVTPKNMNTVPLEKRIFRGDALIKKSDFGKKDAKEQEELSPSLLLDDDEKTVIVRYTGKPVGFVDDDGRVNISAKSTLEYAAEMAHATGCPGIIFFDKMNEDNPTPNFGFIKVVNPCGEQPLLNFEACNLGSVNVYSCVENYHPRKKDDFREFGRKGAYFYGHVIGDGENRVQRRVDLKKLEEIVADGVNFLDNVIDMGKYPFKKIYSNVKINRKIGLGVMGIAETTMTLGVVYESEEMEHLAEDLSEFMYEKAFKASEELAKKRGVFPNWKGSIYDPSSKHRIKGREGKIRNATLLTVAPNGTTGQFAGVTGGIEPMFGLYFKKNLANSISLVYSNKIFEEELRQRGLYSEDLIKKIEEAGSVQDIEDIPDDMKARYKTGMEINPIWHVRIQGAFQKGKNGKGVDNAVSKTVNLPAETTPEDFFNIFLEARKRGCKGITGYRDGTIEGQPLTIRDKKSDLGEIVNVHVPVESRVIELADGATKYRIERGEDVFHVIFTEELMRHSENGLIYRIPKEDFQLSLPPGDEIPVEFSAEGMDRTDILKGPDPDYAKLVERWKSVTGNRSFGIGPNRINSPSHGVGLAFEHFLLTRGIVGYENNNIVNLVRKPELKPLKDSEKKMLLNGDSEKGEQQITNKRISGFLCEDCSSTKYIFEQGCHEPVCAFCKWSKRGSCS